MDIFGLENAFHHTFHNTRALQKITVTPTSTNINRTGNLPANRALSGAASTPPTISPAMTSQCESPMSEKNVTALANVSKLWRGTDKISDYWNTMLKFAQIYSFL